MHFKGLTSFINAYRQKMTQSSSQKVSIRNSHGEEADLTLEEMNLMSEYTMGVKRKQADQIKFDYQEFMSLHNLEKAGKHKEHIVPEHH